MAASLVSGQTAGPDSVRGGVYTEEQAIRGQDLYNTHCWQCHGETLAGQDQAPPLVGPQFGGNWTGEPLAALVERIGTMPPDKPGSLSRAQSVDVLSYILWYNGLPTGAAELATGQGTLGDIRFETPAPSAR